MLKIVENPKVQFLEFLDKEKVVDTILEVQYQAPKNLKVQKTAGATQVQTIDRCRRPCVQRPGPIR